MRVIEFTNQNGQITNRDVREMFKLSNRVALDEINKLIELQLLKPKGKRRALHYILL
jgi:predicted HTH transcriptional regulator